MMNLRDRWQHRLFQLLYPLEHLSNAYSNLSQRGISRRARLNILPSAHANIIGGRREEGVREAQEDQWNDKEEGRRRSVHGGENIFEEGSYG